ncbi:MAG: oxidoreductase, partial [Chloroflexi bacterium]|nr:oxidoreductase [Chloroflexota bacterium]
STYLYPLYDASLAFGFIGLALMAVQFILTARIKWIKEPFGSDLIYHFHRQISIAAFFLVLAHPILLFIADSRYVNYLNIFTAPLSVKPGVTALFFLVLTVISAEYRKKLKIHYDFWKFWHGILTTIVISAALIHIFLTGTYLYYQPLRILWLVYSASFILLLLYTRFIYPLTLIHNKYTVSSIQEERGQSWTVRLQSTRNKPLHFKPGQFAWITTWKTPFSDSEHPFSISSSSEKPQEISFTIKDLGKFTTTIKSMQVGQAVYVDGPHGAFSIDRYPQTERLIFIAGGIGITPIMSMLRSMADRGDQRPAKLFYNNRDWDSVTFREEIDGLKNSLNLDVIYTLEKPPQKWNGESGYMTREILHKHLDKEWIQNQTDIFLCGPQVMMDIVEKQLQAEGFPESQIHYELFSLI